MKKKVLCCIIAAIMLLTAIPAFADTASPQFNSKGGTRIRNFTNANIKHYWRPSITLPASSSQWSGNMNVSITYLYVPSGTNLKLTVVDTSGNAIGGSVPSATTTSYSLSLNNPYLTTICLEFRNTSRIGTITTSGSFRCNYA